MRRLGESPLKFFLLINFLLPINKKEKRKAMNSTLHNTNPEKSGAKCVSDYRSISLVSGPYKILPKVLSNRLKEVLSNIIDGNQFASYKTNKILHSVLVANSV